MAVTRASRTTPAAGCFASRATARSTRCGGTRRSATRLQRSRASSPPQSWDDFGRVHTGRRRAAHDVHVLPPVAPARGARRPQPQDRRRLQRRRRSRARFWRRSRPSRSAWCAPSVRSARSRLDLELPAGRRVRGTVRIRARSDLPALQRGLRRGSRRRSRATRSVRRGAAARPTGRRLTRPPPRLRRTRSSR